jgi:hypothetical protein
MWRTKTMNKKYYTVCAFGEDTFGKRVGGCHIIKAESKEDALSIRERHGISNPRFAQGDFRITCKEIRVDFEIYGELVNQELIERRRKGLGGSVWYEDENGNLQTETV